MLDTDATRSSRFHDRVASTVELRDVAALRADAPRQRAPRRSASDLRPGELARCAYWRLKPNGMTVLVVPSEGGNCQPLMLPATQLANPGK